MWIRSQDRESLVLVDGPFYLDQHNVPRYDDANPDIIEGIDKVFTLCVNFREDANDQWGADCLATFDTKEEAVTLLDAIETWIAIGAPGIFLAENGKWIIH